MSSHKHDEPDLYIVVDQDLFGTGKATYIAPLLTCRHYGKPTFDRSSKFDFPADPWICPECGETRQLDVRVQYLLSSGAWDTE